MKTLSTIYVKTNKRQSYFPALEHFAKDNARNFGSYFRRAPTGLECVSWVAEVFPERVEFSSRPIQTTKKLHQRALHFALR
jgi:hypothetical protein